jgi:hypothetical protein
MKMTKLRYKFTVFTLILCIILATGCGRTGSEPEKETASAQAMADEAETSNEPSPAGEPLAAEPEPATDISISANAFSQGKTDTDPSPESPVDVKSQFEWPAVREAISRYISVGPPWEDLGISAHEAFKDLCYQYTRFPDGYEKVENFDEWLLIFSDSVWAPGSISTGVAIRFDTAFPEWTDAEISVDYIENSFEGKAAWVGPDRADIPYYAFSNEVGILKIYTNNDGTRLRTDMPVLLQKEDTNQTPRPFFEADVFSLPAASRTGAQWEMINSYVDCLGKTQEEIFPNGESFTIVQGFYNDLYSDNDNGVLYDISPFYNSIEPPICRGVEIPACEVFPELQNGNIDKEVFWEKMGLTVSWAYSIYMPNVWCYHLYSFEDCSIYILSYTESTDIKKDDFVYIKPADRRY